MGRGGLLLVCCGMAVGEGGRLFACPRRGCVGKSCRFVRFVRFSFCGGLVVVVSSVVLGGFVVVVVVFVEVCGESVGGIAGSAHSVPPGVRSYVGVGVGGIAGSDHKVSPGVLSPLLSLFVVLSLARSFASSVVGALVIVVVSVGTFDCIGVGGVNGFGLRLSLEVAATEVEAPVLFAELTILFQLIAKGRLSSGLSWCSR